MSRSQLLILACSATKRIPAGSIYSDRAGALDLYDGPAYRIARKYVGCDKPRTAILSAEHGLIGEHRLTELYDRKMDDARASELAVAGYDQALAQIYRPSWRPGTPGYAFDHFGPYREVFVFGGALYRRVIETWDAAGLFRGARLTYTHGGIGMQLHQLKAFLDDCAGLGAEVGEAA